MIGLLLASLAFAGADTGTDTANYGAWSDTAVELMPDLEGRMVATAAERLGAHIDLPRGWSLAADASALFQKGAEGHVLGRFNLWSLGLRTQGESHDLQFGRIRRLDTRGFQYLDGASFRLRTHDLVEASAWVGRLWSPEQWNVGETYVGGVAAHFRPPTANGPSRTTEFTLGWEGRGGDLGWHSRLHLAGTAYSPKGSYGTVLAQIEFRDTAMKGDVVLKGSVPTGRTADLGAEFAWHRLDPVATATVQKSSLQLIAPDGYGLAGLNLRWRHGRWAFVGRVGAASNKGELDSIPGGYARTSLALRLDHARYGLFATTAAVGGSWTTGGGAEVTSDIAQHRLQLTGQLAGYWLDPIDSDGGPVVEGRVRGVWHAMALDRDEASTRIDLRFEAAAGADRGLAPWVRGGLSLDVRLARRNR